VLKDVLDLESVILTVLTWDATCHLNNNVNIKSFKLYNFSIKIMIK